MTNNYEKYIGYDREELKYKKETVIDSVSGNEVEKLVERTPEELENYKMQKESEFDNITATWTRLGIKKCCKQKEFDEKKFSKIYLKLINERLNEISSGNQAGDIESDMLKSIEDVEQKYHIGSAFKYYDVKDNIYLTPLKIFKGASKSSLEKMFYSRISTEKADEIARNRLQNATSLKDGVALIQELQKTHNSRSFFFKVFHPFKNSNESRLIREMKNSVMQKFSVSAQRLERSLSQEVDKSSLKTTNSYKVDEFINYYCKEKSGKNYSQSEIDVDRQNVSRRADDEFVESQNELNKIINEEAQREPIVVDDARENDGAEHSSEPVREDPIIINVPNNDKF